MRAAFVIFLAQVIAGILLPASGLAAAPGGIPVEAISDEFDTLKPMWTPGLRGAPEFLTIQNGVLSIRSVDNGDDPYPSAEDLICTYADRIGRSLDAAEQPSVTAWVWFPPFDQWPTGTNASGYREWFGVRVTAYDTGMPSYDGLYWPGIYVATDDDGPCLIARVGDGYGPDVTIGRINVSGWWTLGLAWNADGRTEYYAAPGRVALTPGDLLHTTPTFDTPEANRSLDQLDGTFLALRMTYPPTGQLSPDWMVDAIRVQVRAPGDGRDFNGDGRPDLVRFNPATGQSAVAQVRAGSVLGVVPGPGVPPGWQLVRVADFDGDGNGDYFLYKPATGQLVVWKLDGTTLTSAAILPNLPAGWQLAGVADLNHDGRPDLVLFNPSTRSMAAWLLQGNALASAVHITLGGVRTTLPAGWEFAGTADFNGDGRPDLEFFHPATRQTAVWYLDGTAITGRIMGPTLAAGWTLAGVGDFNADGKQDFLIHQPATRRSGVWTLNGTTVVGASYIVDAAGNPIVQPAGWDLVFK